MYQDSKQFSPRETPVGANKPYTSLHTTTLSGFEPDNTLYPKISPIFYPMSLSWHQYDVCFHLTERPSTTGFCIHPRIVLQEKYWAPDRETAKNSSKRGRSCQDIFAATTVQKQFLLANKPDQKKDQPTNYCTILILDTCFVRKPKQIDVPGWSTSTKTRR